MRIWWRQTIWVVLMPITTHIPSFINVTHTEFWIFYFLLSANQNRYANEVLNMHIPWRQTIWVVLVSPTTHIPSLTKIGHCVLIWERRFTDRHTCKWKLSGPFSIAGSPQKTKSDPEKKIEGPLAAVCGPHADSYNECIAWEWARSTIPSAKHC